MKARQGMHRAGSVIALAAGLLISGATAAGAHIGIDPGTVPKGAEVTTLHFEVPNESETVSTVKLEVILPESPAFKFVRVQPTPGWQLSTQKGPDGSVLSVAWEGGEIKPGEFQMFGIRVGPMPAKGKVVSFKAVQTYADGTVSRWIQKAVKGTPEPEFPTPVLELTAPKRSTD